MRYRSGQVYAPVRLSFFGIRFAHSSDTPQRERFPVDSPLDVNISEIALHGRGCLLPFSEGITKRLQKEGRYTNGPEMNHFALSVRGEKPHEGIKGTIRAILQFAKFHIKVAMKESYMHPSIYFKLSCHPAVLKSFAQLFKARQPLHISQLDITLLGPSLTSTDMHTALTSIAECYASKWKHNTETFHVNFVEIQCPTPVPERYLPRAQDKPDATGLMIGHLSPGPGYFPDLELGGVNPGALGFDRRHGDEHLGFHAEMQAGWRVRGRWQDGETLFRRNYPCAHVPDPMWE